MEEVILAYKSAVALQDVSNLLARVKRNPKTGDFDNRESIGPVLDYYLKLVSEDRTNARTAVRSFLERLMIHFQNKYMSLETDSGEALWLYDYRLRISKMLALSMILEGKNLRSFDPPPEKIELEDIPMPLVLVKRMLDYYNLFGFFQKIGEYVKKEYKELEKDSPDYISLYLEQ